MRMRPLLPPLLFLILAAGTAPVAGQFDPALPSGGPRLSNSRTQRWQVGVVVTARAPCVGMIATVPVPTEWPEQQVELVERDVTRQVRRVSFRTLNNGVRQMVVAIPQLRAGDTARALLTYKVTKHALLPPEDPGIFSLPGNVGSKIDDYLKPSPKIESTAAKIVAKANEIVDSKASAWEQVEQIYDWVREHVEYQNGKLKGALAAMEDGTGDCEELTSLFIAFCRVRKIPARTVWVPGHCYPEFYLVDKAGVGHWLPCQAAGTRDFGGMPDYRPILQKGDNFKVPEVRDRQRYVAEFLKVKSVKGSGGPQVKFVRELLPD